MNAITIKNVKKSFAKSNFTLDLPEVQIPQGYVTGFIGENGAGKTTTIKLLMGLLTPEQGEVSILGCNVRDTQAAAKIRREIGYVGETSGFFDMGRLKEIVSMLRPFYPSWDDALFARYLDRFSLDLRVRYKTLSKGKQKQFALAIALARHPRLLLLDEPTANLDPLVRDEVLQLFSELIEKEELTVLFSTHITSDLDKIADHLLFIHEGHPLLTGEKDTLLERHRMVKGGRGLLCPEVEETLINWEQGEFGFCGLSRDYEATYALLGDEAAYEKADVENIFLGYLKNERRRR